MERVGACRGQQHRQGSVKWCNHKLVSEGKMERDQRRATFQCVVLDLNFRSCGLRASNAEGRVWWAWVCVVQYERLVKSVVLTKA